MRSWWICAFCTFFLNILINMSFAHIVQLNRLIFGGRCHSVIWHFHSLCVFWIKSLCTVHYQPSLVNTLAIWKELPSLNWYTCLFFKICSWWACSEWVQRWIIFRSETSLSNYKWWTSFLRCMFCVFSKMKSTSCCGFRFLILRVRIKSQK